MKHLTLFFSALLISTFVYSQTTGSGTITFSASTNVPIEATATSLFDGGAHVYQISGNTNEAINFSGWVVEGTLGSNAITFADDIYVPKNPSGSLNVFIKATDVSYVNARVYDIKGRLVSQPQPLNSNNGTVHIYDPMSTLSDGLYFVEISNRDKTHSLKFIKKGDDNSPFITSKSKKNNDISSSRGTLANNYVITWNNYNNSYWGGNRNLEVQESSSNNLNANLFDTNSTENGDFAIIIRLNGSPVSRNFTIAANNTIETDSSYTRIINDNNMAIFYDAFVSNSDNPTPYQFNISGTDSDPDFLTTTKTIDIYQDVNGEINSTNLIELTPIPNQQDITMVVRDFETLNKLDGVTVQLYDDSDDSLIDTQISDVNGEVFFDNVPGETAVYTKNSKSGYYTKTNHGYSIPLVDHISEMDTLLNIVAVKKFNYWNDTQVTVDTLNMYMPQAINTEFVLGHWRVYFPDIGGGNQVYKDHFDDVATYLGFPGAIIDYDTPFSSPYSNGTYETYQPHLPNREVHEGLIGTNITNYSGGGTGRGEKILSDGEKITFFTTGFNLGGLDWSSTDHEIGNALGFPLLTGNTTTFKTSRDTSRPENFAFTVSMHDTAIMPFWLRLTKLHFDMVDSEGRLIEFSTPSLGNVWTMFEE